MTDKLPIIVAGANGRMGHALIKEIQNRDDVRLQFGVVNETDKCVGKDAGEVVGIEPTGCDMITLYDYHTVIGGAFIDFVPLHLLKWSTCLNYASEHKIPYICGATTMTPEIWNEFEYYSKYIPIVYSPNMSVGMTLLFEAIRMITPHIDKEMPVSVTSLHHKDKKDKPSGTSLAIQTIISNIRGSMKHVKENANKANSRFGYNSATFDNGEEYIKVAHEAYDLSVYARGAIEASLWAVNQKPGLYSMKDVLGL